MALAPQNRRAAAPEVTVDSAWEVLDRFGLALAQCDQARDQIRLALDAVGDSLGADAVCWHPGRPGDDFEQAGTPRSPPAGPPRSSSRPWPTSPGPTGW